MRILLLLFIETIEFSLLFDHSFSHLLILTAAVFIRYTQKKADEMKAMSFQSAIDTIEKLEVKLTEFAKKVNRIEKA
jgi:hypothetical protein